MESDMFVCLLAKTYKQTELKFQWCRLAPNEAELEGWKGGLYSFDLDSSLT